MGFISKPFISIVLNSASLYLVVDFVKEISYTGGIKFFVIGGLFLGLINAVIKPLMKIISFPLVILTGGLFLIVINAFVLWFLKYFIGVINFQDVTLVFPNLGSYVIGAIVLGVINWASNLIIK